MENPETIQIWWKGPFSYDEIMKEGQEIGLYQVYGNHILYGKDVLLYIGMTINGFQNRLKDRWIINNSNDFNRISIYLGTIFSYDKTLDKVEEEKQIKQAEALLINVMTPAFNSSYINSVGAELYKQKFAVCNLNNYRSLLPELSSMRWWNNIGLNYEIVENFKETIAPTMPMTNTDEYYGFYLDSTKNIWFGVDSAYWDNARIPLIIAVSEKALNENELEKAIDDSKLDINHHDGCFYLEAYSDLRDIDKAKNVIQERINAIKKAIKNKKKT